MNKKSKMILIIVMVILVIVVALIFINLNLILYSYDDNMSPGSKYNIMINFSTKELYVKVTSVSSTIDFATRISENSIKLTDEEISMIKKITQKKDYDKDGLSQALSSLVLDDEVFIKKNECSNEEWNTFYFEGDLNGDEIITEREFGNNFLKVIIEETINN